MAHAILPVFAQPGPWFRHADGPRQPTNLLVFCPPPDRGSVTLMAHANLPVFAQPGPCFRHADGLGQPTNLLVFCPHRTVALSR